MYIPIKKEIINYDNLARQLEDYNGNLNIKVPTLSIQENIEYIDIDDLRSTIFELSERFPHRRIAVTWNFSEQIATLEIHPVTGSA